MSGVSDKAVQVHPKANGTWQISKAGFLPNQSITRPEIMPPTGAVNVMMLPEKCIPWLEKTKTFVQDDPILDFIYIIKKKMKRWEKK